MIILSIMIPIVLILVMIFHHQINEVITKYYKKKFQKKTHRILYNSIYNVFHDHGEGLYYVNIKSAANDIPSKLISLFSRDWVHSITVLYAESWDNWLTESQQRMIQSKLNEYYHEARLENIKVLVMGSADDSGMNFFDFSNYQDRHFSIRRPALASPLWNEKAIVNYIMNNAYFPYDVTGLFFWLLRLFNDEKAFYCSEKVYKEWLVGGVKVAKHENPSPWQIEKYRRDRIIYSQ